MYVKEGTFKGLKPSNNSNSFPDVSSSWLEQLDTTGLLVDARFRVNYSIPFTQ